MAAVDGVRIGGEDGPVRKRIKVSELPVSSAKRSTIDGLLHVFKKKGEFDSLRKQIYSQFEQGDSKATLLSSLRKFTDEEIERDPAKYLGKDRRLAAPLLEGAAARADIYPTTEADIGVFISSYLEKAEQALREIRHKEIGEDAAREEEAKGAKTDQSYAAEAQVRRSERAKAHLEVLRLKKKKEKDEARKRELEALKKREQELIREKEKLERDQKRRLEREAARARQKALEEERRKKIIEDRERKEKEAAEAVKKAEEEKERRRKEQEAAEAKRLEEEAMRMLIKEGERLAEKTNRRSDYDRNSSPDRRGGSGRLSRHATEGSLRGLRTRSPTPDRSIRRQSVRDDDDRTSRRGSPRREPPHRRDGASVRTRSRSPMRRRWRDDTRSPPPRRRDRSWSRSPPPRRAYRDRDYSPPRRFRSRSRSPPDIDRYVPSSGGRRDDRRDRDRDRDRVRRDRDRDRDRDRGDRDRDRERDRDRDRDRDGKRPRDSSRDRRRSSVVDRPRSRSR